MKDQLRLKKTWVGQIFHSRFDHKSRGVAILIHKIPFSPTKVIEDVQGQYVIVVGSLYFKPVILLNVYAPNWGDEGFIERLIAAMPSQVSHSHIWR